MKLNETIRRKRREQGLTQEQVAVSLGVSASAVHKWEKGSSYPDITLLPALARLLGVDLNTLLSFQEELTPEEIGRFCDGLVQVIREQGIEAGLQMAMKKIREYPTSSLLLYNAAGTLDGALLLFAPDRKAQFDPEIEALYRRAARSETAQIRDQANFMRISRLMEREDFTQAQALLDGLPDAPYDKKAMQANLLRRQGMRAAAAELLEQKLLEAANDCYAALLNLMEIALEEQDGSLAELCAGTAEQTVRLYGLWESFAYAAPFQLAAARQDAGQCVALLQRMLPALKKRWKPNDSPLYGHIRKEGSGLLQEQLLEGVLKALETDEQLLFLHGHPAFKEILECYRGQSRGDRA